MCRNVKSTPFIWVNKVLHMVRGELSPCRHPTESTAQPAGCAGTYGRGGNSDIAADGQMASF